MSWTRIEIGPAVARHDHGRTEHPVAVRYRGVEHSARVIFALVNHEVPFGVQECSDESFDAIVAALASRRNLAQMVAAARVRS